MHPRQSQRLLEKRPSKRLGGKPPLWLPPEMWMIVINAGLIISDLKALRLVSRFHRDIATPTLFSNAAVKIEFGGDRVTTAVARRIGKDRQFGLMVKSLRFMINDKRDWCSSPAKKSDMNVILRAIKNLDNLQDLHLDSSPESVIIKAIAGNCRKLKCLKLSRIIDVEFLPYLARLPCLEKLDCASHEGTNPLEHIFPTKVLYLSEEVIYEVLDRIKKGTGRIRFDTLERLRLPTLDITLGEEELSIFFPPTNTNMKELSLSYWWLAERTAQWLDSRRTSYPNLECLWFEDLVGLAMDPILRHSIVEFVKHHPLIEDLSFMSLTGQPFHDVISCLPHLKRLKAFHLGIKTFSVTWVEMLVLYLPPSITYLRILTDELKLKSTWTALLKILPNLPILTTVVLNECSLSPGDMTQRAKDIADKCKCVEHITFSGDFGVKQVFRVIMGLNGKKVVRAQ